MAPFIPPGEKEESTMTSIENPLGRASPLPCLRSVRIDAPLKSALSSIGPILPDIVSSAVVPENRSKKRVRFALKLEAVAKDPPFTPDHENSIVPIIKPSKRVIDPWRENGPLYGAYVEYLERKDLSTPDTPELNRPSTPEPVTESSTFTHTFVIRSKSPEMAMGSLTVTRSPRHLPRIVHRTKPTKHTQQKSLSPVADPYLKQRARTITPPRAIQSRKILTPINQKMQLNPSIKRVDLTFPSLKTVNSNEKIIRTEQPLGTTIVNEYLHTRKLTEILTNPLPGTNNEINYISGESILPTLSKTPPTSCHDQINTEPFFFQNHNNDHFQPIIH